MNHRGDYIRENELSAGSLHHHADLSHLIFIPLMIRKRKALAMAAQKSGGGIKDGIIETARGGGQRGGSPVRSAVWWDCIRIFPWEREGGLYLFSTMLFMLAARGLWRDAWVITRRLACFAQLYMMCSNLIIFTSGLIFPYYLMPKWPQHCIQDIFAHCQYCRGTKGCEPRRNRLGRCWPQLAGTALYTVFWLAAGRHVRFGALKRNGGLPRRRVKR